MSARILHLTVPPELGGRRLDQVLDTLVAERSRAQLQKLVRKGRVQVGGKRVVRSNVNVRAAVEISIEIEGGPVETPPIGILHEDADVLVVEKPAGLLTHAAARSDAPSLAAEVERRFGPLPTTLGEERPGIVHRLDRETSGVLIVARTAAAMDALRTQFRERRVEKVYLALVSRIPASRPFVVDEPLGPVPGKADRQRVDPNGKGARTDVQLLEAFARHALVACSPLTGRRHQIRVHLSHCGFPVLGDPLYGTRSHEALPPGVPRAARLALHAHRVGFEHPRTGERLTRESALPADLAAVLEGLRAR